jgi:hypothetical protein
MAITKRSIVWCEDTLSWFARTIGLGESALGVRQARSNADPQTPQPGEACWPTGDVPAAGAIKSLAVGTQLPD